MTLQISIADAFTGEEIVRDMTDEEYQAELDRRKSNDSIQKQIELEAVTKAEAKAELLDKLGITAEEAALLLS
jgi:hypothetical protein